MAGLGRSGGNVEARIYHATPLENQCIVVSYTHIPARLCVQAVLKGPVLVGFFATPDFLFYSGGTWKANELECLDPTGPIDSRGYELNHVRGGPEVGRSLGQWGQAVGRCSGDH